MELLRPILELGVVIPGSYRNRHDAVNGSSVMLTILREPSRIRA